MTLKPIIMIALLAACSEASRMAIDAQSSTFAMSVFWVRARVAIIGGMPPYAYQYSSLPAGWKQVDEFVYIPLAHLNSHAKYPCRLLVQDHQGHRLATSLTFTNDQDQFSIEAVDCD